MAAAAAAKAKPLVTKLIGDAVSLIPKRKLLTLVMVVDEKEDKILLGMKKRGFGMGKWNGFGGKVDPGESVLAAAARELEEEAGIRPGPLTQTGHLLFQMEPEQGAAESQPELFDVRLFRTDSYEGQVTESDEMKPEWYPTDKVPFDTMWLDDRHWFPLMLGKRPFRGYFRFQGHSSLLEFTLAPLDEAAAGSPEAQPLDLEADRPPSLDACLRKPE